MCSVMAALKINQKKEELSMVQLNEQTALLDKAVFSNISILGFSAIENLIQRGIVEINTSPIKYITAEGQEFNRLSIENDGLIDRLVAGAKLINGKYINYCILQTMVRQKEAGNLVGYTTGDYFDHLQMIAAHLAFDYGINVDFSDVSVKELEINRTFRLDNDFSEYHRVINLIMSNLPSYLRNQMDYKQVKKDNTEYETYYAATKKNSKSDRYLLLKIYNKTKALEKIIVLTDSYMRVEIRLIGSERVKRAFHTNRFAELTDEIINAYFDGQMQTMIVKPYRKWQEQQRKYLKKLIQEQRKDDIRHWQTNVLRILQNQEIDQKRAVILDVGQLMDIVDTLQLSANRKYDVKSNFRKQAQKYETVFCNGDDRKMEELIEKLTAQDTGKYTAINA